MTKPLHITDLLMDAQAQRLKLEPEYECWSCAEYVPESRMVDKHWSDEGVEFNELICFGCIETGVWRQ